MPIADVLELARALSPFLTAVSVGLLSLFSVRLGNRLGIDRDVRLRQVEVDLKRKQRWEDFESQCLIDFQDAAVQFLQVVASFKTEMTVLLIALDESKIIALMSRNSGEFAKAEAVLFNLLCRIQEDTARELAMSYMRLGRDVKHEVMLLAGKSGDQYKQQLEKVNNEFDNFNEKFLAASGHVGGLILDRINGVSTALGRPPSS